MLEVTDTVTAVLSAEGITLSELQHMVDHGAITSLHGCNRRFHNWLFLYQYGTVIKMVKTE